MASPIALLLFFALFCGAVVLAARWVGRPLPVPETAAFFLATLVFLFPGFFAGKTIVPVDHAMLLAPWSHVGAGPRYNANLNDGATQMAPWMKAVRMAWKEGSLPLRDRWNGSGMVLAANGQSAAFSPFTFLMFPFALASAFTIHVGVKIFLALSGTFLWLRELEVSRGAAAFGAVLFALSFSMSPWLLWPHSTVLSIAPWAFFAIELFRSDATRRRAFVLLVAVFAVWPLCGHPESAVVAALFAFLWLAGRFALGDLPDAARLAGRVGIAAAIAIGLSAFMTVPEAIAIGASNRVRYAEAFRRALPTSLVPHGPWWAGGFLTVLFPRAYGDAIDSPMIAGPAGAFPEITLGYIGVVGAAAALLVLRPGSPRRKTSLALLLPVLVGLCAATGTWPAYDVALRLPVFRLMFVLRYFTLVALGGAALAAFEADRLARDSRAGGLRALAPLLPAAGIALLGWRTFRRFEPLHAAAGGLASQRNALAVTLAACAAVGAIAVLAALRPRVAPLVPLLFAGAAAAELLFQGTRLFRFDDPGRLFPETPLVRFLRSMPGPFRVAGTGSVLFPNTNVFAGVEDIRTHDPVEREDYVDFLDRAVGYPPSDYFKVIHDWSAPELDLLNVRYVAGDPGEELPAPRWRRVYDGRDGVVYENADALPRVFAASRIPPEARHAADGFETSGYRERTNEISFASRVPAGSVPAVVSVVQDGGWTAEDESGRALATSRAAGVLLGLDLPNGYHEIRLRYRPPGFEAGSAVSAATALGVAAAAAFTAGRQRRRRRSPGSGSG